MLKVRMGLNTKSISHAFTHTHTDTTTSLMNLAQIKRTRATIRYILANKISFI